MKQIKYITNPFWSEGESKDFGKVAIDYAAAADVVIDQAFVRYECLVNQAHILMLFGQKIIKKNIAGKLLKGLEEIKELERSGKFHLIKELEDVHSNVEQYLIDKYGIGIGGYLRLGIARNDQIYTDTRMLARDKILVIAGQLADMIESMMEIASKHVDTIMPGYTHLRISQPITYAHWLLAKAYHFYDDLVNILITYDVVNSCPLGIFEMAGTHLPIDRNLTAKLLGFPKVTPNSLYTANQRGELEAKLLADLSLASLHIKRTMTEIIIFSTHEFGLLEIADAFTSGGTAQPNLKNPDVLEVVRAKLAKVPASFMETWMIMETLPSGFNRDTQETKPILLTNLDLMIGTLPVVTGILATLKINTQNMEKTANLNFATAPDMSIQLSIKGGVSFREAYKVVKTLIKGGYLKKSFTELTPSFVAQVSQDVLGKKIVISQKEIDEVSNARSCVLSHTSFGGPAPSCVKQMIKDLKKQIEEKQKDIIVRQKIIQAAYQSLENEVRKIIYYQV